MRWRASLLDLILLGGSLIDGSGTPRFASDIGISGERIAVIGDLRERESHQVLDVSGLSVTPGFIDMHGHSDLSLLADPRAASKLHQGVTTEISGQCGISAAPLFAHAKHELPAWTNINDIELTWTHMQEYLTQVEEKRLAINYGTLVGHSNLRYAITLREDRAIKPLELIEMRVILAQALEEGALGMSSGLFYTPGSYADGPELSALGGTLNLFDGLYATHIRNEGSYLEQALKEAIQVGTSAHVPVHISHLKLTSRSLWGQAERILALLEHARQMGIDLSWDQYPYAAAATTLDAVIPPRFHSGGLDNLLLHMQDPGVRADIIRAMQTEVDTTWENMVFESGWDRIQISSHPDRREWVGRTIADVAVENGRDPYEFALDLVLETRSQVEIIDFCMFEEDVEAILCHPDTIIVTDAQTHAPDGLLSQGSPHPRAYGTYPRILGHYVRERNLLTWEDAVRKMSVLPAERLKLEARGLIREGYYADLVVFDPHRIADRATYSDPHQYPTGIHYVLVNGQIAIQDGEQTEARAGQVLRRRG
jgi:N-acyl-D-amino-acid deacylase